MAFITPTATITEKTMIEGAGSGEAVEIGTIKQFRTFDNSRLIAMRRQGLSDQKVALINQILAERAAGTQVSEKELVKRFEESRTITKGEVVTKAPQFLSEQVVDTFKSKGREIPITKIFVTNEQGNVIREANKKETEFFRSQPRTEGFPIPAKEGTIERAAEDIRIRRQEITQREGDFGRVERVPLAVGSLVTNIGITLKHPILTGKSIIKSISLAPSFISSGAFRDTIGTAIKREPEFFITSIGLQAITIKGIGKVATLSKAKTPIGVSFKGISQTRSAKNIITRIDFETTTGFKGRAFGFTETVVQKGKGAVSKNIVIGRVGKVAKQFPTGRTKLLRERFFISTEGVGSISARIKFVKELGSIKVIKDIKGFGAFASGQTLVFKKFGKTIKGKFLSVFGGLERGKITDLGGITATKGRPVISFGEIKKVSIPTGKDIKISAGKGVPSLKQQSLQPIVSSIQSAVSLSSKAFQLPKTSKLIIPTLSFKELKTTPINSIKAMSIQMKIKTEQVQPTRQVGISKQLFKTKLKQETKLISAVGIKQGQIQREILKQGISTKQFLKTGQALKLKQIVKLKTTPSRPTIPIPTLPLDVFIPKPPKIKSSIKKTTLPSISVSVRRRKKFKIIATGLSLEKAIEVGKERTGKTLAATFKLSGKGLRTIPTPKGFTKKPTKGGILLIETPSLRLSTGREIKEIQIARRRK